MHSIFSRILAVRLRIACIVLVGGVLATGQWGGLRAQQHLADRSPFETIRIRPNVYVIFGAGANVTVHVGDQILAAAHLEGDDAILRQGRALDDVDHHGHVSFAFTIRAASQRHHVAAESRG